MDEESRARAAFPLLFTLFAGYFHQDWDLDDPTWQAVVSRYVRDSGPDQLRGVRAELASVLNAPRSEDDLRQLVLHDLQSDWGPPESSMREWLEAILHCLAPLSGHEDS